MEVRQLNTLIRAAQFQSFSKAAESLGYSQSAVTVQIKALEEELGVRLFDRMGKRVILTAQGQCFLEYANSILDTIHNARRALSEDAELEGCLHIGTLESLCFFRLPGLMHQFRVEHPKVSLRVTTGSPEELIEKMERGEVDLICILDEPRYSNSWHKCNEVPEEVVFVASPDIDLGHPGPYRVAELLDKPFFLTERNANYRRTFDRFLASRQIELTPSLEISDTSFIIKMLERSSGISLPCFICPVKFFKNIFPFTLRNNDPKIAHCCHNQSFFFCNMHGNLCSLVRIFYGVLQKNGKQLADSVVISLHQGTFVVIGNTARQFFLLHKNTHSTHRILCHGNHI